ncbi:L-rhamnono-y-lactonase [Scheffersomyces xylosifermentans]|uniref:L-rhamnono-y-lactonase n=1 Tax=Scheffersomyces xylosifermentans TaxID=1304137 RepID=UPI00315D14DD
MGHKYLLLDSHIHLYSLHTIPLLKWEKQSPLYGQRRLDEYWENIESKGYDLRGVVWIECDAKTDVSKGLAGLDNSIEEFKYICRNIDGTLLKEEGESSELKRGLIKAMVPFAPIPLGSHDVEKYVDILKKSSPAQFKHVKGFRYLIQDKEPDTITKDKFIDGLKWLDRHNYIFDLGIDIHSGGTWQFEDTLKAVKKVPKLKYIINHLTKPNLYQDPSAIESDPTFIRWKELMTEIYKTTPNSYMKLSGGFSEAPESILNDNHKIADYVFPWFKVSFDLWGVDRTIWASNWPVCAVPAGPKIVTRWFEVTELLFDRIGLDQESRSKVYFYNAFEAYNI